MIPETNYTPRVEFKSNGELTITGKSLPEDTSIFYEPMVNWVNSCITPNIFLTIRLDYMNSSSAHQVTKLLMSLKDNPSIKECIIDWYYETDDEDNLDFGRELEYLTDFRFKFHEYAEALS
jgi:hypothetical protein